jgi:hypothetical protein
MTAKLARLTLRLYPHAFQRRYGDEMRALLEQSRPGARGILDLMHGALAAHLHPPELAAAAVDPGNRVRASAGGVLVCWVVFAAAGFAFYKTTEDAPFSAAGRAHLLLGAAHVAVQAAAVTASAVVVLGALPLIWAACRHARDEHRLRIVVAPILPLALFGCLTAILIALAGGRRAGQQGATGLGSVAFTLWGLIGLACAIACAVGCRRALFATPLRPGRLLVALGSATFVSFAMMVIAAAVAAYAIALALDASRLSATANGPFQVLSTGASLAAQVIVMVVAAAIAVTVSRRGWRVASRLGGV